MRITKINLQNIKRHENLTAECDYNSFGFLGENGSGKTTVIRAICLALTRISEKDQTLSDMLRGGAKSGKIAIWFRAEGKPGYLEQTITRGGSSRRTLKWPEDSKPLKSAEEIDTQLSRLISSDRHSIVQAAFPSQGDLDRMVFGRGADREDMYIKLLGLAFCDKRTHVLDGKMQSLAKSIVDVQPRIDEAKQRRQAAQTEFEAVDGELKKLPDVSQDIDSVTTYIRLGEELDQQQGESNKVQARLSALESGLRSCLDSFETGITIERLQELVDSYQTKINDLNSIVYQTKERNRLNESLSNLTQKRNDVNTELERDRQTADTLYKRIQSIDIDEYEQRKQDIEAYYRYEKQYNQATNDIAQLEQAESELPAVDENRIKELEQRVNNINLDLKFLEPGIQSLIKIRDGCGNMDENLTCTDCGLQLDPSIRDLISNPEHLRTQIESRERRKVELQKEATQADQELQRQQELLRTTQQQLQSIRARLDQARQRKDEAEPICRELADKHKNTSWDGASIQSTIAGYHREQAQYKHLIQEKIPYLEAQLSEIGTEISTVEQSLHNLPAPDERDVAALEAEVDALINNSADAKKFVDNARNLQNEITSTVSIKERMETDISDKRQRLVQIKTDSVYGAAMDGSARQLLLSLKDQQNERHVIKGRLESAKDTLSREDQQLKTLQTEQDSNKNKQLLIDELRSVKDMLHRTGLPLTYAAYKYDHILDYVSSFLERMGADFELIKDQNTPLSFLFRRISDPDSGDMSMYNMSGGQRVLVSVAFFLAVQQMLIPDLGFMALDEPSTHLDEKSKASLVELIEDLNNSILGEERQLFLIDHDPSFQHALEGYKQL